MRKHIGLLKYIILMKANWYKTDVLQSIELNSFMKFKKNYFLNSIMSSIKAMNHHSLRICNHYQVHNYRFFSIILFL
jgi:hypothetical protein